MKEIGRVNRLSAAQLWCIGPGSGEAALGSLVRVGSVYGTVSGQQQIRDGQHEATIDFLGEVTGDQFRLGVSAYPRLGDPVAAAEHGDYDLVYTRKGLHLGVLAQDPSRPAGISPEALLAKHFAVLGASGSGKSCAVALLLRALLQHSPHGHVVVLDPHAEYATAFPDLAVVFDTSTLTLPIWMMDFEETAALLVRPGPDADAQVAILKEVLLEARRRFAGDQASAALTVDTPAPYRTGDLLRLLDAAMGRLERPDGTTPYLRLKARLEALQADRRFSFMFSSNSIVVRDTLSEVVASLLRIPGNRRPMSIVDLSGLPSDVTDLVVSLIARMVFSVALWGERELVPPVLLVCEEAHRYVPADPRLGFGATRRALERIAKEGRKYGISLGLVTQRPSELSSAILSQCGTLVGLRLNHRDDLAVMAAALPDSARGLLDALPCLRQQDAVVVGEAVQVPTRIRLDQLGDQHQPRSHNADFLGNWGRQGEAGFVDDTVLRWRRQGRSEADDGGRRRPGPPGPKAAG
jgi:DNA helicase HerA-like ATPase